jgi:glycosyltransferase involved in cell wall biosynthesis
MVGLDTPAAARTCLTLYVGPPRGGCYERLRRLVRALLARGWTVHFVGTEEPVAPHPGLRFVGVAGASGSPSPGLLWRASRQAARTVRRQRVPLVFTFGAVYTAPLGPLLWRSGTRVVTFLRGSLPAQERARGSGALRRAAARVAERLAIAASDRVVAVSGALAAMGGARARCCQRAPAAASLTPPRRGARWLPAGAFIAGYAGAIAPIKSLETLLEARACWRPARGAARIRQPRVRLRDGVAGARETLDGRAHLLAWRPDARMLLAACDVVVLPSLDEGCPNLLLEAMAEGRPCVGARCAASRRCWARRAAFLRRRLAAGRAAGQPAGQHGRPRFRRRPVPLRAEAYRFDWTRARWACWSRRSAERAGRRRPPSPARARRSPSGRTSRATASCSGTLSGGGDAFPIEGGIPRFCGGGEAASFGYQWTRSTARSSTARRLGRPEPEAAVRAHGLAGAPGRTARPEAGCGMGRFTEVLASTGAEV